MAHGYYIYSTLKRVGPKIRPAIFSKNPTRIACIGGGPGTEIIGLCRYFREVEAAHLGNEIEITVFDKESSWRDACQMVLDQLAVGLNVRVKFVQFDATDPATYRRVDLSGFHLVMANFFTSEIRKAKIVTAAKPFWKHVFDSMGAGKIFLVVDFADNGGAGWKYVEGIVPSSATTVLSDENLGMSCSDSKQCIAELEAELDHRPKKNAQNIVKVVIT